ncbi:MAG: MFS transporter [Bacillota bacterium]
MNAVKTQQKKLIALLIISTAYIAVFINIQGFKAMLPLVQDEFLISRAEVGLYSSFYFFSSVIIAIFSGKIADRLGTKNGLVLGVGLVAAMIALHSISPTFSLILVLAFVTGIAFSLITPSVNKGVLEISEPSKRSLSMGIVHGGGGFGGVLGAVMLPYLGELFGWRTTLLFGSIFAIIVALFILKYYRQPANLEEQAEVTVEKEKSSLRNDLGLFLRNRYLMTVFAMGIAFGVSISSVTGHFPIYMVRDLGTSTTFAGMGLAVFHLGGILGQPFWGFFNEKVFPGNRRIVLSILGFLICGFQLFFGLIISRYMFAPQFILLFSFLLGFSTLGIIAIYFTTVSELVAKQQVGTVTGLALIFPRSSTVIMPPLFGLAADITGTYTVSWIILGILVAMLTSAFFYFSGKFSPSAI